MLSIDHPSVALGVPQSVHSLLPAPSASYKQIPSNRDIWIITGPAGCGKSTVAQYLAEQLNLPFIEGDEFHPPSNIAKMSAGQPLTDADRWDWLIALRQESVAALQSPGGGPGVVLTCSALKEKYRDVIRMATYNDQRVRVRFVYLQASEDLLLQRVKARQGHFMKDSMIKSQFRDLEEPRPWEVERDCLVVDVAGSMSEVQQRALDAVIDTYGQ